MSKLSFPWLTERRQRQIGLMWLSSLIAAALLLASLYYTGRITLESDIYALLPPSNYQKDVSAANTRVNAAVNQKLFLRLTTRDASTLEMATQAVLNSATQSGLFRAIKTQQATDTFGATLFAQRAALLSADDRMLLRSGDYDALLSNALTQLSSPGMPLTATLLHNDPLLFFPRFLMARSADAGSTHLVNGWPTQEQGNSHARLLILDLRASPFQLTYQEQVNTWLIQTKHQISALDSAHGAYTLSAPSSLQATGTVLFAAAGSREAQREISTIGLGSTLGLVLLVLLSFRSPRPLLTELAAISSGCLIAFLGTYLIFQKVHLITLVFGASLIGVSVDYSMYYLCAQAEARSQPAVEVLRRLLPGLLLALSTTIAGYVCLALAPFPGLRQIAVFSALGLSAAWLTGMLLLPRLKPLDTRHARALLAPLQSLRLGFKRHPSWQVLLVLMVLLLSIPVAQKWRTNDNVKALQALNPTLLKDDSAIRAQFNARQSNQYFIVYGNTAEEVAQREEALTVALRELVKGQQLHSYQALTSWLPSLKAQQAAQALQAAIPLEVLHRYSAASGLALADLTRWQQTLSLPTALSLADLRGHPLQNLALSERAHLVTLSGVENNTPLSRIVLPGVQFVDPVTDVSEVLGQYRQDAQWLLLVATALLALLLALRYGWRSLPNTLGPVLLALITTLALMQVSGVIINVFSLMALFLILGIGADYAIFYRESDAYSRTDNGATSVAVTLCMLSTSLSFGLLGLSQTPAIRGFGLTVFFGVVTSFVFATLLTHSSHRKLTQASIL